MPYITIKASPRTHQISFDEILNCTVPKAALYDPDTNTGNTVTNFVERRNLYDHVDFLKQFDFYSMIEKLKQFCDANENLYKANRHDLYYTFYLPKKSGGLREINAPNDELMLALRELKTIFEVNFKAMHHTSAFAYVKHRSHVDALKKHQQNGSFWYLKTDFSDFFGSTTPEFLYSSLVKVFPFSEVVKYEGGIEYLKKALDLCFLDGGLPQGTPISPMLTNIMMIPIDHMMSKLCREKRIQKKYFVYTRYADDIIISCKYDFRFKEVIDKINEVCATFGAPFVIKDKKTRYGSRSGSNWNLGLMINKDNEITIGHKNKKRYRAMLHNFVMDSKNGIAWEPHDVQTVLGLSSYYSNIEPEYINSVQERTNAEHGVNVIQMLKDACVSHQ